MLRRKTPLRRRGLTRIITNPIKKIGRVGRYRIQRRAQWLKDHGTGPWKCYLCLDLVYLEDMELDHVLPKGSTLTEVAEADNNLRPTHRWCNRMKGSSR